MAKLLLAIEGNAANSNSIVLRSELPVNPTCHPPAYLPKLKPRPPALKPGAYRASGLVQLGTVHNGRLLPDTTWSRRRYFVLRCNEIMQSTQSRFRNCFHQKLTTGDDGVRQTTRLFVR